MIVHASASVKDHYFKKKRAYENSKDMFGGNWTCYPYEYHKPFN